MSLQVNNILNKKKGLPWQFISGESLILDPEKHEAHELNETASFIWKQIDGEKDISQIASLMSQTYAVDIEIALADTLETTSSWLKKAMVECC